MADKEVLCNHLKNISYKFFEENRYTITDFTYLGLEYTGMCNNGYTKFHTARGKAYWLAQNELGHLTPDWKFHVSVKHDDIDKAWNLIVKFFLENECRSGMKVLYLRENTSTAKGREITIYIFKYTKEYVNSSVAVDYRLSYADEHSEDYWVNIVQEIENNLTQNSIQPNGLANGDLAIGKYVSLRNEAYIYDYKSNLHIYPPDNAGWNAAGHDLPFNFKKFKTKTITKSKLLFIGITLSLLVLFGNIILYNYKG